MNNAVDFLRRCGILPFIVRRMSKSVDAALKKLDMLASGSGLFRVSPEQRSARERKELAAHQWRGRLEKLLREASEHGADWVYFRLESQAGGPKPEAFLYDRTGPLSGVCDDFDIAQLQLKLWNYGKVPFAFIFQASTVEIFNLLREPNFTSKGLARPQAIETLLLNPAESLAIAGAMASGIAANTESGWDRFSGRRFDNGTFWEDPENQGLIEGELGGMAAMVEEMRVVRKALEENFKRDNRLSLQLAEHAGGFVRRLLILTLMVRFMEARGILPDGYFGKGSDPGRVSFNSILGEPKEILKALDRLAKDFNGDIFRMKDAPGGVPMRAILLELSTQSDVMRPIADFAEGKIQGEQRHFWQRYSFRHLPVEAISYVYEDFLEGKSQSFYTPHHLVDLLLDESMPPQQIREAVESVRGKKPTMQFFPVLDPACGSGVFLVGAWQRLVETFCLIEPEATPERLKELMVENIFGVDLEADSVELTIFSLCIALCSTFPQNTKDSDFIFRKLKELKFPDLKSSPNDHRNIDRGDFFEQRGALISATLRFRLIIGNPPFESSLTSEAEMFDNERIDEAGKEWPPVPDKNISYLFLRAVPPLLELMGKACLLQNAGLLYNEKPERFRKSLIENWHVPAVLDFASIGGLFKTRKFASETSKVGSKVGVKTVAVIVERREPDFTKPVLHATIRRSASLDARAIFEIDPQDLHWVDRGMAAVEPRVWKANLLGGGRLLELYKSLTSGNSLADRIKFLKKTRNWISSEGLIAAKIKEYGTGAKGAKARYKPQYRPEYFKLPLLDTEGLQDDSIETARISECGMEWFLWPRDERLFSPPHLLVKEHENFAMILRLSGSPLLFRHKIVGFSAPDTPQDRNELEKLHAFLRGNRRAAQFFAAFGPQYLIFRMGTPLKKSLMDLPYPEDGKVLFKGIQKHLLEDVLEFMIPLIKDGKTSRSKWSRDSRQNEVLDYAKVFQQVMGGVFVDIHISGDPIDLGRAWCVAFHRGSEEPIEFGEAQGLEKYLEILLSKDLGRSLRCSRIVRHFEGKSLFIIKPKPKRYWLKSAAIRDADETFAWWINQQGKPKNQ